MAVDWNNDEQVQEFRGFAVEKGMAEPDIDKYIEVKRGGQPAIPQADAFSPIGVTPEPAPETLQISKVEQEALPEVAPKTMDLLPQMSQSQVQPGELPQIPKTLNEVPPEYLPQTGSAPVVDQQVPNVQKGFTYNPEVRITQQFGNPNAKLYGKNKSGRANINRGLDIAAEPNEPQVAPPEGNWIVQEAKKDGKFNTGWGNYVVIVNKDTGESIRRSHLDKVNVNPGEVVTGKQLGTTGRTGRTTGYHMDIEYTNSKGQLSDFSKSPYFKYARVKQ